METYCWQIYTCADTILIFQACEDGYCRAFENACLEETDNISEQDHSLYGMKTRRACEDGQVANVQLKSRPWQVLGLLRNEEGDATENHTSG